MQIESKINKLDCFAEMQLIFCKFKKKKCYLQAEIKNRRRNGKSYRTALFLLSEKKDYPLSFTK